ncbi:uncharacterized protein LOC112524740 [Cynara cardunculus var. scolymus]|nr:uncharacterized protein LOC112524740 [Cynara cardunculus var. scolymus]
MKERDGFQFMCQRLHLENLILQQQVQKLEANASSARAAAAAAPVSYVEDNPIARVASSSESTETSLPLLLQPSSLTSCAIDNMVLTKGLPKKGKFLQAMMEAGPLLQTILLTGPVPQWQNPPPQLNSIHISLASTPSAFMISKCNHSDGRQLISKR